MVQHKTADGSEALDLRGILEGLFKTQRLGVLATQQSGQPYCSLVGFAATDDLRYLLFSTARASQKYENLKENPRAAVLVDSRSNTDADFSKAIAVTAVGKAEEISKGEHGDLLSRYLSAHPFLEEFARSTDCALFRIKVTRYVVVSRFQDVVELRP